MITCTQFIPAALDEAAAIVEAEWMRLQQQGAARVDDRSGETKEAPARQVRPPRVAIDVAFVRRPGPSLERGMSAQLIPSEARLKVWATERAPPAGR